MEDFIYTENHDNCRPFESRSEESEKVFTAIYAVVMIFAVLYFTWQFVFRG